MADNNISTNGMQQLMWKVLQRMFRKQQIMEQVVSRKFHMVIMKWR